MFPRIVCALSFPLALSLANAAEWREVPTDLSEWSDSGNWWRVEDGVFIADSKGGKSLPKIHYLE